MAERLSAEAAQEAVGGLRGWQRDGQEIHKAFAFKDFREAIAFVNDVANYAEAANHHPDITINYNRVTLTLTSHDAGGLTRQDIDLAIEIDRSQLGATGSQSS